MLPEGWTLEPLERVAHYDAGRTPSRANPAYWEAGTERVPWVAIADMEQYGTVRGTSESITTEAVNAVFRRRVVPAGTLLMSFKLTIGRVATLGIPACHNEAIISIYPRAGVDQRYLGYFLSHVDYSDHQDRQIKGNTLNQDKINRIPVVLPPEPEQRALADVLDRARAAIGAERQCLRRTQAVRRAAMRELFTRGLRGEPQKETDIGLVPESWSVVGFSSIREWLQYGTSTRCSTEPGRYPVLRIPNIEPGRINTTDLKYCDFNKDEAAGYLLEAGDLLFIRTNGVLDRLGSCAVFSDDPSPALFASYLIRARLKRGIIEPRFAAFFLGSERGTSLVAGRATPAADGKYNLNTGIIDSLPIPVSPALDEQREIVAILDAIDQKIGLHQRKLNVLEAIFKAFLHKTLTGEIRVSDLDLSVLRPIARQEASA